MIKPMNIALISMDQKWEDKEHNFEKCRRYTHEAKKSGAEVIIFPEMTLTGFSLSPQKMGENIEDSPSIRRFHELSATERINIIWGLASESEGRGRNNLIHMNEEGEIKALYAKIHPFSYIGEDKYYDAGDKIFSSAIGPLTWGFTICYDLRFPELYTALGSHCDVLVNIANWPETRISHWNALLKARAIENQVYVVGVNRVGVDGVGLSYVKSSQVIDPGGETMQPDATNEEMEIYSLDEERLSSYRESFPARKDRRVELYRKILSHAKQGIRNVSRNII